MPRKYVGAPLNALLRGFDNAMKEVPGKFLCLIWSVVAVVLFTGLNNVVYNWVFLRRIHPVEDRWSIAKFDYFAQYWTWPWGRVLCTINLILVFLPIVLWYWNKRSNQT